MNTNPQKIAPSITTPVLLEWTPKGWRYVPSGTQMHPAMGAAFLAWYDRQIDAEGTTATSCRLDCGAGVFYNGDDIRLAHGRWTRPRLMRLAALLGYAGEMEVRR